MSQYIEDTKEAIKREFNNLPVVDAKHDMRLFIAQPDIDNAERSEFGKCVFANACKRQFDSNKVLFLRTVAYVPIPDEEGNLIVERFQISSKGQVLIRKFDRGEDIKAGGAFLLLAPSKSRTLEAERKKTERHRAKRRKRHLNNKEKQISKPQQGKVAKAFLKNPDLEITPRELHEREGFDWPLTSTRRSIKNLTDANILKKTEARKRVGVNSPGEYVWRLNDIPKSTQLSLLESIEKRKNINFKKSKLQEFQVRNGIGVIRKHVKTTHN